MSTTPCSASPVCTTARWLDRRSRAGHHHTGGHYGTVLSNAIFAGATFTGDASFAGTTFSSDADFGYATFSNDVRFWGATFTGNAWFSTRSASPSVRGAPPRSQGQ
ncbi:pentapeptide repeat-containing protein [Streptomyces decoyicus]